MLEAAGHVVIIDPNDFAQIQQLLEQRGWTLDLVFLTHEHCDHISGLNSLRELYDISVLASSACSDGIQSTTLNMTRIMESYLYFKSGGCDVRQYPKFTCRPADMTFDESFALRWYEYHFRFLAVPGHTLGSTCIVVNEQLLFSGDYFLPGEAVLTRLPGGDEAAYEAKGKPLLRSLPDNIRTFPGHGEAFLLTKEVKRDYGL